MVLRSLIDKIRSATLDKDLLDIMRNVEAFDGSDDDDEDGGGPGRTSICNRICQPSIDALKFIHDGCAPEQVFDDVEMFRPWSGVMTTTSQQNSTFNTVAEIFTSNACTRGGKVILEGIMRHATSHPGILASRQRVLAALDENMDMSSRIVKLLHECASLENDVLWAFTEPGEEAQALHDMVYFKSFWTRSLNRSPACLTAYNVQRIVVSPLIGILTPVMYVVIPYLILRYHTGIQIGFVSYLRMLYRSFAFAMSMMMSGVSGNGWIRSLSVGFTVVFYFQSMFSSIEVSRTLQTISRIIATKMRNVHAFMLSACQLFRDVRQSMIPDISQAWLSVPCEDLSFSGERLREFSVFRNFGRSLKAYHDFDVTGNGRLLRFVYLVDAIVAIHATKAKNAFCYVDVSDVSNGPQFIASGLRHPCLTGSIIANDVYLDGTNMILTGPNAGGKSTLLKSVLIAAVLAQSVTVVPCVTLKMSAFKHIRSHVNVPDCKGSQSLFEAEMLRCKETLDMLHDMDRDGNATLVVMDEIFSSTNVVEGIAGAFAVAKSMSALRRNITLISTHFVYLCKLSKETGGKFKNYRMQIEITPHGIRYPYMIEPGVSRQHVALDLLKKNGFDSKIIDDAISVRSRLTGN